MVFEELIRAFGEKYGMRDLAPGSDGVVAVSIDDMVVAFHFDAPTGSILTIAELGEVPTEGREIVLEQMMAANYPGGNTSGATLALNRESSQLCEYRQDPLDPLDIESFSRIVESFVNNLEVWKRVLSDTHAVDGLLKDARPALEEDFGSIPFGQRGFIRV